MIFKSHDTVNSNYIYRLHYAKFLSSRLTKFVPFIKKNNAEKISIQLDQNKLSVQKIVGLEYLVLDSNKTTLKRRIFSLKKNKSILISKTAFNTVPESSINFSIKSKLISPRNTIIQKKQQNNTYKLKGPIVSNFPVNNLSQFENYNNWVRYNKNLILVSKNGRILHSKKWILRYICQESFGILDYLSNKEQELENLLITLLKQYQIDTNNPKVQSVLKEFIIVKGKTFTPINSKIILNEILQKNQSQSKINTFNQNIEANIDFEYSKQILWNRLKRIYLTENQTIKNSYSITHFNTELSNSLNELNLPSNSFNWTTRFFNVNKQLLLTKYNQLCNYCESYYSNFYHSQFNKNWSYPQIEEKTWIKQKKLSIYYINNRQSKNNQNINSTSCSPNLTINNNKIYTTQRLNNFIHTSKGNSKQNRILSVNLIENSIINGPVFITWLYIIISLFIVTAFLTFGPFVQRRENSRKQVLGGKKSSSENWIDNFQSSLPKAYTKPILINKLSRVFTTLNSFITGSFIQIQVNISTKDTKNQIYSFIRTNFNQRDRWNLVSFAIMIRAAYQSLFPNNLKFALPKGLLIVAPQFADSLLIAKLIAREANLTLISIPSSFQGASPKTQLEFLTSYGKLYASKVSPCLVLVRDVDIYGQRVNYYQEKLHPFNQNPGSSWFTNTPSNSINKNLIQPFNKTGTWEQQVREINRLLYTRSSDDLILDSDNSIEISFYSTYCLSWDYTMKQIISLGIDKGRTVILNSRPETVTNDQSINRILAILDGLNKGTSIHVCATATSLANIDSAIIRHGRLPRVVCLTPELNKQRANKISYISIISTNNQTIQQFRKITHSNSIQSIYSNQSILYYKSNLLVGYNGNSYSTIPSSLAIITLSFLVETNTKARINNLYRYRLGAHWLIPAWWQTQVTDSSEVLPLFWIPCLDEPSIHENVSTGNALPAIIGIPGTFVKRV